LAIGNEGLAIEGWQESHLSAASVEKDHLPLVGGVIGAQQLHMRLHVGQHGPHAVILRHGTLRRLELYAGADRRFVDPGDCQIAHLIVVDDKKSSAHHAASLS